MTRHLLLLSLALLIISLSPPVLSGGRDPDPPIYPTAFLSALREVEQAKGPEIYAAIDQLQQTATLTDPASVEAALTGIHNDSAQSAGTRAYAKSSRAALRWLRGDNLGADALLSELAYVEDWLFIGPFDNEGGSGFDTAYGPEADRANPHIPRRFYQGKNRPVQWRALGHAFPQRLVSVDALTDSPEDSCSYLSTLVEPKPGTDEKRDIAVWFGSSGAVRVFWNGKEAFEDSAYRKFHRDRHAVGLSLGAGKNVLTFKICSRAHRPSLLVRLATPEGAPDTGLTTSTHIEAGSAGSFPPRDAGKPARSAAPGPYAAFKKKVSRKDPSARDLYEFARFLHATGAEDPLTHESRDAARKAAQRDPRVEHLLLAGELAEDRNARAEWIRKAARVAQSPRVDVLLAQARLAEASQNWRAALPFYERASGLEPDNAEALAGKVRFYANAGLMRTSTKLVEDALAEHPRSFQLLTLYAQQLAKLNRAADASAAAERAARLLVHAPDLAGRMELSVARRDTNATLYWAGRLLGRATHEKSVQRAARAYRGLGRPEMAAALYARQLSISPHNISALQNLSGLHAERGNRDEQIALLDKILKLHPQAEAVREYLAHLDPGPPREDESYAWDAPRFLDLAKTVPEGFNERVLVDLSVTTMYATGLSSEFRQLVFQPLTPSGAAKARQYAFHYEASRERVKLRGARVYRKDGRIDEAIESGEVAANDPSIAMYTSGRNYYIRLPRLEPFDVVELLYRIDDIGLSNEYGDYFGDLVHLQRSVPVAHAEYILAVPKSRKLQTEVVGLEGVRETVRETSDRRIYRFVAENVPAIVPEPSMPAYSEVMGHIHVSTYETWEELGKWYWKLAKDQFELDAATRRLTLEITRHAKTDFDKVQAVYGWVTNNTRYVALEFGIYGYKPHRSVQTVARGWGDCKDKAAVIVTMLKELGIDATLVALRTRRNGAFRSKLASLAPFDHAIAYVPSLDLYLDGTAEHAGAQELPTADVGAMGLLINEGDARLVELPGLDEKRDVLTRSVNAAVTRTGAADLQVQTQIRGSIAPYWRSQYSAEGTRRDRVERDISERFPGFALDEGRHALSTSDLADIEAPVQYVAKGKAPQFARQEPGRLSIPLTTHFGLTQKYASLSKRRLDVRLPVLGSHVETFEVTAPKGSTVIAQPTPKRIETPFGTYALEVSRSENTWTARSSLAISVDRIEPQHYESWRQFCLDVDEAQRARLVLQLGGE